MSRTKPTDLEWAELTFPCAVCGARQDQWCETKHLRRARYLHNARYDEVRRIVKLSGFERWLEQTSRQLYTTHDAIRALMRETNGGDTVPGLPGKLSRAIRNG